MGEKCKPSYRNLNTIQSYSEQKYATVQWCEQNCENDEWLKQQVELLKYLSPPAVRKSFNIVDFIDFKNSYGCEATSVDTVGFKAGEHGRTYYIDFKDDDEIKIDSSSNYNTCWAESYEIPNNQVLDSEGNPTTTTATRYRLPTTTETSVTSTDPVTLKEEKIRYFGTGTVHTKHNSAWYVGFNKAKNYYVRPDWLKNWRDKEIPSVCRAQTFKVPKGYGGTLLGVDLGLEWNGTKFSNCGSPLYVQIWKTYDRYVTVRDWDNDKNKKQMVYKYIKYANISENLKNSGPKYSKRQRYEKYKRKSKYTAGKHKGEVIKDKKGKPVMEVAYRKKDDGEYVRKREKIKWLGHNHYSSSKKKWLLDRYYPLTHAVFEGVGDSFPHIDFDKPIKIEEGETYAIVLFSPLSEWKHCPRWAGWGRNCKKDNKYSDGFAFMSEDNGKTWVRYGKNGIDEYTDENNQVKDLPYKQGKYTPQDFLFQCKVRTQDKEVQEGTTTVTETTTYDEGDHYIYLEPIYTNPITNVKIEAYGVGLDKSVNDGRHIEFDISTDGDYWMPIEPSTSHGVSLADNPSPVLLVRARLWHEEGINVTPYLDNFKVVVDTLPSKEFYARSIPYPARTSAMLGANVWGRLYAPFNYDATVSANAEIIEGKKIIDHFKIISINDLNEDIVTNFELDEKVLEYTGEAKAVYLTSHTDILETLKNNFVYVKPTTFTDKKYLLSFSATYDESDMIIIGTEENSNSDSSTTTTDETTNETIPSTYYTFSDYNIGGLSFSRDVAYPILNVSKQDPKIEDSLKVVDTYKEWIDYTFDYTLNQLFFKQSTLDELTDGDLYITYNPIFITRLSRDDVGRRIDVENNTVEEGLILDYFKETITITRENVETRRVGLRVLPTDPIREVRLYKKNRSHDDEYQELYENWDYTLDTSKKVNELVFNISNIDGVSSILSEGDTLTVVYTPYLEDDTLYVGYYATREDASMQCRLENMYWEYKV